METIMGVAAWGDPEGRSGQQGPRGGKINIYTFLFIFCFQRILNY